MGGRYQVKRSGRLSLQLHHHRAEHLENESVICRAAHSIAWKNPGKIDLELIEVQTGSYLGEDDIVRIEDDYKRT